MAGICEWGNVQAEVTKKGAKYKPEKIVLKGLLGAHSILWINFKAARGQVQENSAKIKQARVRQTRAGVTRESCCATAAHSSSGSR